MSDTYIIAEVGSNHGGSLEAMRDAVHLYADLGASAVKFQWTSDAARMAERRNAPELRDVYEKYLQWPKEWHGKLAARCAEEGVDYMCTVFLPGDVGTIAPHVARFKVASFEALDYDLHAFSFAHDKPVYISTGTLNEYEVSKAIEAMSPGDGPLYCVSAYPAPLDSLNLAAMREGPYIGLSDHSDPTATFTGGLAVAAGASVIEAHVRVPGQSENLPDYSHAMMPSEFDDYVRYIRMVETVMGESVKRLQECEQPMAAYRVR